jgi:hypothetical protein
MSEEIPEGWTAWSGGENPVPGTMVELMIRGGVKRPTPWRADHVRWQHEGRGLDIIAYRVIEAEKV